MDDEAMQARVDGRAAVAARTAWFLDVRGQRFRCLATSEAQWQVQARIEGRWQSIGSPQKSAGRALLRVANAPWILEALK